MSVPNINFRKGNSKELLNKKRSDDTLYVVEDLGKIYKGYHDITKNFQLVSRSEFDSLTVENTVPSTFYMDNDLYRIKIHSVVDGVHEIVEVFPGYITSGSETEDVGRALVTQSYLKKELDVVLKSIASSLSTPIENVSSENKVVVTVKDGLGNSGYSIGDGEIKEDSSEASDKVLATERAAKKAAEEAARGAISVWSSF